MSDLLTISEVAEILGVGEDTVTRRFAKVKGVIDLGSPETPKRRRYRVLRIPKSVVEKFLLARGGPVDIKAPTIVERARLLTFVPASQWSDVVWLDEEE